MPLRRSWVPVITAAVVLGSPLSTTATATTAAATAATAVTAATERAALSTTCPRPGGVPLAGPASSGTGVVFHGHGWGHGLGMSQYGAQGAARLGCSHEEILLAYYPGTRLAHRELKAPVELTLSSAARRSTVKAEDAAVTWTAGGRRVTQPRLSTWTVTTTAGRTSLTSPTGAAMLDALAGGVLEARHQGTTMRLRSFASASSATAAVDLRLRWGVLTFTAAGTSTAVRETITGDGTASAVDRYLWGLAEVPVTWPREALRAQVDAARTFLTHSYDGRASRYVIGVTAEKQVYSGAAHEDEDARFGGAWRAAVAATRNEVVVNAAGAPIWSMYASSHGGRAESRAYVYGSAGGFGYLTGLDDSRWDAASDNPRRSWAVAFTPASLGARLGFTSVSSVTIAAPGTAARGAGLSVTGVRGGVATTARFTGDRVRSALGLPSPVIEVSWSAAAGPTPPSAGPDSPSNGTTGGTLTSSACSATACAEAAARFSGSRGLTGLRVTVQDRSCNGRRAYVRLQVRYTDGTSSLTPLRHAAARCTPPATTYSGLSWSTARVISGFAVVVGESGGVPVTGRLIDNPNT
jgi:stage II sporulation protein D